MRTRSLFILSLIVLTTAAACKKGPEPVERHPAAHDTAGASRGSGAAGSGLGLEPGASYIAEAVQSWPHDPQAFTQGLEIVDGIVYESTGLYGQSTLRQARLETGEVLKKLDVPSDYFAEGITFFKGRIFQLTWQNHVGFIYDGISFQQSGTFPYEGEGWGLTHDDQVLIMSDGTSSIRFLDPSTFAVRGSIGVTDDGRPIAELNELEYVGGEILANVWQTDSIVRIDPYTGKVLGWIDLAGLHREAALLKQVDVLNGIAWDAPNKRLLVTGKLWPRIYEIRLRKVEKPLAGALPPAARGEGS